VGIAHVSPNCVHVYDWYHAALVHIRQCTATIVIKPNGVKETLQWRSERLAQVQSFVDQTELTSELNLQGNYFTLAQRQEWAHDELSAL